MTPAKPLPAHKAASAARMKRLAGNGEQSANARTRTAKAAPARHVVPHQAAANRMMVNRLAARNQAHDMRMARMQRAHMAHMAHMDRQMARMSNWHAGPARMQRKPPKCNPHAGGCSRHG
jgi:hypothetical protein